MTAIHDYNWEHIREIFAQAAKTSHHFSIATVGPDGMPHVTPIGSLFLEKNRRGFYFEEYCSQMVKNFKHSNKVCILAVNTGIWYWLKGLIKGKTSLPIAVRLMGTVGDKRLATEAERAMWLKIIKPFKWTKGYDLLWKNLKYVREIDFDAVKPVRLGRVKSVIDI